MAEYPRQNKDGSISWYIQLQVNGVRRRQKTYAKTRVEAKELCRQVKRQLLLGEPIFIPKDGMTFREFANDYLRIKEDQGRRSIDNIRQLVARCTEHFDDMPLKNIRPADIDRFVAWMRKYKTHWGENISNATINRHLAQLKNLFAEAVKNEYVEKNPTRFTKFLDENNVRDRVISSDELQKLLDAAAKTAPHIVPIIKLGLNTGMRRGEILGLLWTMVDLDEGIVRLLPENTKTNRGRDVPLNDEMILMLRNLRVERDDNYPYVFLFKGQPILEIKRSFNSACRRAGIKDFHFHDLRHTFVTNARKAGVHDFVIMAITGHTTFEMFKRYNKVDREDLMNGINSMGKRKAR